MILDALRPLFCLPQPQPRGCPSPPPPSMEWQAGDAGSQADKEPDPRPPLWLPAEIEWPRANVQGQSINGGTGSPSLPGPDAQWNILRPVQERAEPGRSSKTPQSEAHRKYGCLFFRGLDKPGAGAWTHTHTDTHNFTHAHTPTPTHSHTHTDTQTYTHTHPFTHTLTLTYSNTRSHTLVHTHTPTPTYSCTDTHSHPHAHICSHAHTHTGLSR